MGAKDKAKPEEQLYQPVSPGPSFFESSEPKTAESALLQRLAEKVADLTTAMEKMNLAEYLALINRPVRLIYINFMAGIARGFGIAVGFALLGAILVYFLKQIMVLNLPVIGDFIADLVEIVQYQIEVRRF